MVDLKRPRLVGGFIRKRREALGLSQRALGMLFTPAVTTQFISNVERGVTPLPPAHVPILCKSLSVAENELLQLLEREYTAKLSGRLGKDMSVEGNGHVAGEPNLMISTVDFDFMRALYDAYKQADPKTRAAFATVCESILNLPKQQN